MVAATIVWLYRAGPDTEQSITAWAAEQGWVL